MDVAYARGWSLGLDLRLLFRTPVRASPAAAGRRREPIRVRVAVVGLGYWGPNLVRNLHELDAAELRRGLRPRPGRARARRPPLPGRSPDDATFDDVLDDDDGRRGR